MSFIILKRNSEITFWVDENGRYGTENSNEIEKTRKKIEIVGRIAEQKFQKAKEDIGSDSDKLLEPYLWLYNQDQMRETWKSFKEEMEHVEIIGKYLLNNPFSEYQQFMYDNYPANYIKNAIKHERIGVDYAEIYLILEKIKLLKPTS